MMEYDEGLTPVEEYNGIFFKRDDLYAPYGENFVTGGKIRQCRDLIKTNLDYIKEECGGTISTASSIHSPQAVIVSKVAEEFGLKSICTLHARPPYVISRHSVRLCLSENEQLSPQIFRSFCSAQATSDTVTRPAVSEKSSVLSQSPAAHMHIQ